MSGFGGRFCGPECACICDGVDEVDVAGSDYELVEADDDR